MNMVLKGLLILNFLVLSSCGQGNTRAVEAGNLSLGEELSASYTLSGEKLNTALRICYAYRSKRVGLRSSYIDQSFSFSVKNRPCNDDETNKAISATLKAPLLSQPMVFDSSERELSWYESVNSDNDGPIATLCTSIIRGDTLTNLLSSSGNTQQVVEFSVNTENDHYVILTGTKTTEDQFFVTKKETFYVQTQNQNVPRVGDDYSISSIESCPEGSVHESFIIEQSTTSYP